MAGANVIAIENQMRRRDVEGPAAGGRARYEFAIGSLLLERSTAIACGATLAVVALVWLVPGTLSLPGRIALAVFALAVIGWTLTKLGDTVVALAAAAALVLSGIVTTKQFYATLGNDLVWLLFSAFVIAAVLKTSGLAEKLVLSAVGGFRSVPALMHGVTIVVVATALVIPSTSGRAALLLPVFLALAAVLGNAAVTRALALVFPTVILLSAGGSLIGAGAHLVASDFAARAGHRAFDYLDWLLLGMPLAIAASHIATEMILRMMLTPEQRGMRLDLGPRSRLSLDRQQKLQLVVVAVTVGLWVTTRLHGIEIAIVALLAAVAITLPGASSVNMKKAAKSVEWDLLLFMAATLLMGQALLNTDADEWLASGLLKLVGGSIGKSTLLVSLMVAVVALLAHLVITSRTTRVTVLVPSFVLPVAALGYDPVPLILLTVFGTGFCQTMTVSAKPVAIFSNIEVPTYSAQDLLTFSVRFMPVMLVLMMANWLVLWPALGIGSARHDIQGSTADGTAQISAAFTSTLADTLSKCRSEQLPASLVRQGISEIRGSYRGRDLRNLARDADDSAHARRLRIVAQLLDGRSPASAAAAWDIRQATVHEYICRFNAAGPDGLRSLAPPS